MDQYCFACWRLSSSVMLPAGGRARGQSGGRHYMTGQYGYIPLDTLFQLIDGYCKNYRLLVCVIQNALKEKEEHVEQLLVERDLERADFARMAARVDEVNFASYIIRKENIQLQWPTCYVAFLQL